MSTVRVAIAGVGNCASSLVQGISYYRDAEPGEEVPGLMHVVLGGYHVGDLEPVAAFDVDAEKVGTDLGKAIFAGQNNTIRFAEVGELGVTVSGARPSTASASTTARWSRSRPRSRSTWPTALAEPGADVLVAYLPVGSEEAQQHYAAGLPRGQGGLRQRHPCLHRLGPGLGRRFREAGVPIVGDDIKSQVGSTIVHRVLTRLFEDRGLALDHTYQLNVGGNMDFKNMLERERLESKKISKTQAVTSQIEHTPLAETTSTSAPPTTSPGWPTEVGLRAH